MSSTITNQIYRHLAAQEGLLGMEQKGCRRGYRGAIDQLLIDKMVLQEAKNRHKNLETLWVDYKKAYNSVPHSWIIECLHLFKICSMVLFIDASMKGWKTNLFINQVFLGSITIRRGIFQGDAMSPCCLYYPCYHCLCC